MTPATRRAGTGAAETALGALSFASAGIRAAAGLAVRAGRSVLSLAGVPTENETRDLIRRVEGLSRAVRRLERDRDHLAADATAPREEET